MLMGKRQKRRLNFDEKAAQAPQFFSRTRLKWEIPSGRNGPIFILLG